MHRQQWKLLPPRIRHQLPRRQRHAIDFVKGFAKQGNARVGGHTASRPQRKKAVLPLYEFLLKIAHRCAIGYTNWPFVANQRPAVTGTTGISTLDGYSFDR